MFHQVAESEQRLPSLGGAPICEPNPWIESIIGRSSVLFGSAACQPQQTVFGAPFTNMPVQKHEQGLSSGFGQPSSTFGQPSTTFGQPSSTFGQPSSTFGQPSTTLGQLSTSQPPQSNIAQPFSPVASFSQHLALPQSIAPVAVTVQPTRGALEGSHEMALQAYYAHDFIKGQVKTNFDLRSPN